MEVRDVFFGELLTLAHRDRNIILLTVDMGAFKVEDFKNELPNQYINMGIAEQNTINVAAGLALGGKKVFCYGIASFIVQRCYEQIKVNLCDMCLPVTIIGYGAGNFYRRDGVTHCITFDKEIMGVLPNMKVITVNDEVMAREAIKMGYESKKPLYIRMKAVD